MIPKASSGVIWSTETKIGAIVESIKASSIEVLVFSIFASIHSMTRIYPFDIRELPGTFGSS